MQLGLGRERLWWWVAVSVIALAGLGLRVVAAHGGLWTDEAWSVIYASEARDALGVFLRINHDNNHHLYSLWLLAIGPTASPLLARVPAIIAGTSCIIVAAILVGRRSRVGGIGAAMLFAVSPALVVFGSEARGYAMMLFAALLTILLVDQALERRPVRGTRWWLAGIACFGMFSHLTMAVPVAVAALWVYLEQRPREGPKGALSNTVRLMGPALATTLGVILFVFGVAAMSPTGMRIGGYLPFSARDYTSALNDLALWTIGFSMPVWWLGPVAMGAAALLIALRPPGWLGQRARLYALLILTLPLALLMLQSGNSGFARYYLASAIGLLLLMSEWIASGSAARPAARAGAVVLMATILVVSLHRDSLLIDLARGRPAAPVRDMAALSPSGARVALEERRFEGPVTVAAAEHQYRVRFVGGCAPADFLLAAQSRWMASPISVDRCGVPMDAVDSSVTIPLTGESWVLYRARSLQSFRGADSGPPPGARNRRLSGRAGVAQG